MKNDRSDRSDGSDRSVGSDVGGALRPSGGYRKLHSFQVATVVYDGTVSFCERFVDKRSRLVDQMVQAARSGRQNIAEGSRASSTSSQTELRLVNVARASLDELLLDYEDFLRQRGMPTWAPESPEAVAVRNLWRAGAPNAERYSPWLDHANPAVVANALICLIHQANFLLDRQKRALEHDFVQRGGYSENLAAARIAERKRQQSEGVAQEAPTCPKCGQPMVLRTAHKGQRSGSRFWGCPRYPECLGARDYDR